MRERKIAFNVVEIDLRDESDKRIKLDTSRLDFECTIKSDQRKKIRIDIDNSKIKKTEPSCPLAYSNNAIPMNNDKNFIEFFNIV